MQGQRIESGIPGKYKNCDTWAEYEQPHTSETAKLCHGGWYKAAGAPAVEYGPCACRAECKAATMRGENDGRRHLPIAMNPTNGIRPLAKPVFTQPELRSPFGSATPFPSVLPSRPAVQQAISQYAEASAPRPVVPPQEYPSAMRSPYVSAMDPGNAPTFLPTDGEGTLERLVKNVLQAMVAAFGWQIYNYLRSIDIFRTL